MLLYSGEIRIQDRCMSLQKTLYERTLCSRHRRRHERRRSGTHDLILRMREDEFCPDIVR